MHDKEIIIEEGKDGSEPVKFTLGVSSYKSHQERGANQGSVLGNSTITSLSQFSKSFNNLFVKDFPTANFNSDDLRALFEPFGKIVSAIVMGNEKAEDTAAEDCKTDTEKQYKSS